ncbi:MAG: 3-dehydroquinate synthase [Phycisphaerae bacterium]|nr:3-dehydroquinate synthase [Phycisphaerae bacterium]
MKNINTIENFTGKIVPVELGQRSYPIYIGSETLDNFGQCFKFHCKSKRAIIITDSNVGPLYDKIIKASLASVGIEFYTITVPAGENSKSLGVVSKIYDDFFKFTVERSDAVIALGGGVVGDLAGFVAATFKRGIKFVQVPTSLLAMSDSSVGGKTGINHPCGKNMIGAFYQPAFVYADINTLKTLPEMELGCGLAETVKHACIRDADFFDILEQNQDAIIALNQNLLIDIVANNCRIKAEVVAADEQEASLRRILNFGHTIGHTFETVLKQYDYHHGQAVALGMIAANDIAVKRGILSQEDSIRIKKLLADFKLPIDVEHDLPIDDMWQALLQDKKIEAGKIVFILLQAIGQCIIADDLGEKEITEAINALHK